MENSIYLGLSRQMALQTNMDIVANNVANMSTPGFRAQNLMFDEFISDPRGADDELSFVIDRAEYQVTTPGSVSTTGNPLDVALNGPGFIGIQGPDGDVRYTRAGNFKIDTEGRLVNMANMPVAGAGGGDITVPQTAKQISIDERGVVSSEDGELGQIMVVEFDNIQSLKPLGDNTYKTDLPPQDAENTTVQQGFLEGSNVKPVIEMTRMIETLRTFQSVQNILQSENERLRGAIQKLTDKS